MLCGDPKCTTFFTKPLRFCIYERPGIRTGDTEVGQLPLHHFQLLACRLFLGAGFGHLHLQQDRVPGQRLPLRCRLRHCRSRRLQIFFQRFSTIFTQGERFPYGGGVLLHAQHVLFQQHHARPGREMGPSDGADDDDACGCHR